MHRTLSVSIIASNILKERGFEMKTLIKNALFLFILIILCTLTYQADSSDMTGITGAADTTFSTKDKQNVITLTDDNVSDQNTQTVTEEEIEFSTGNPVQSGSESPALEFVQYRQNQVKNITDGEMVITTLEGIKSIPPGVQDSVLINSDESISVLLDGNKYNYQVRQNLKPKIILQALYSMSADEIHLTRLQSMTGYRVIIKDDYADQLEIKITGPVKYEIAKQTGNEIIINVKLNAFPTERAFENYTNSVNKDRYSAGFNVTVKDKYAPHKISQMGMFYFTDW